MGQQIEVLQRTVVDGVLLVTTDRSVTGQDGVGYSSQEAAAAGAGFGAALAAEILASDTAIDHVYVASNQVVVRRDGGWDDAAADAASVVVSEFFRYYPDSA
jgi:hypothetical protein